MPPGEARPHGGEEGGVPLPAYAIVLVENEVTMGGKYDFWADDTGVQYQFPNAYLKRVIAGRPFVYYRGVRRAGGRRGAAEYFGTGVIADIWQDLDQPRNTPARQRRWFCAIENYEPFDVPVPAKNDGVAYERIGTSLGWRTGVREISLNVFDRILSAAHSRTPTSPTLARDTLSATLTVEDDPIRLFLRMPSSARFGATSGGSRRSDRARAVGDWAEERVLKHLRERLSGRGRDSLRWVAREGKTPGWDISYEGDDGQLVAVEVKGTTLSRFPSLEMTSNEWSAAERMGSQYVLALVVGVCSNKTRVALMQDPFAAKRRGLFVVEPLSWRLRMVDSNDT